MPLIRRFPESLPLRVAPSLSAQFEELSPPAAGLIRSIVNLSPAEAPANQRAPDSLTTSMRVPAASLNSSASPALVRLRCASVRFPGTLVAPRLFSMRKKPRAGIVPVNVYSCAPPSSRMRQPERSTGTFVVL